MSMKTTSLPTLFGSRITRSGGDITIVANSIMTLEAMRAAKVLEDMNINVEIVDIHCISHQITR